MTRSMLLESNTPTHYWPEAVATSAYLLNRLPTSILNHQTPLQVLSTLTEIPPPLTLEPRIFRCSVFVHTPKPERTKLSPCAIKYVFVGYEINQKGYRCFDPKTNRMFVTMNCNFLEIDYFFTHLSGQEENQDNNDKDPLSWISVPMSIPNSPTVDLTEVAVSSPTEQVSEVEQPIIESGTNPTMSPVRLSNVSNSSPSTTTGLDICPINTVSSEVETVETIDQTEEMGEGTGEDRVDPDTGGYILPARSNRGVPPKRYTPKKVSSRKSRYSVICLVKSYLSEMAQAFEKALYEEEEIPQSWEEAMKYKHWREAMKKEIDALI